MPTILNPLGDKTLLPNYMVIPAVKEHPKHSWKPLQLENEYLTILGGSTTLHLSEAEYLDIWMERY